MTGFPATLWADATPGAWVLLALALYGLAALLLDLAGMLRRLLLTNSEVTLSILVLVHNQEHQIEGIVRTLAQRDRREALAAGQWELILVDLESTDDTPIILERLARQFEHLRVVSLPTERAPTACEAALFLCRSPVTLLVDMRHAVDGDRLRKPLAHIWK